MVRLTSTCARGVLSPSGSGSVSTSACGRGLICPGKKMKVISAFGVRGSDCG